MVKGKRPAHFFETTNDQVLVDLLAILIPAALLVGFDTLARTDEA